MANRFNTTNRFNIIDYQRPALESTLKISQAPQRSNAESFFKKMSNAIQNFIDPTGLRRKEKAQEQPYNINSLIRASAGLSLKKKQGIKLTPEEEIIAKKGLEEQTKQSIDLVMGFMGTEGMAKGVPDEASKIVKHIVKETKVPIISKFLREIGTTEKFVESYAEKLAKAKTEKEVVNFLKTLKTAEQRLAEFGEMAVSKVDDLNPLTQEARKYKSAEEFVNSQTGFFRGEPSKLEGRTFGGRIKINKDGIPETLGGNMGVPTSKDVGYVKQRFVGPSEDIGELGVYIPKREIKMLSDPNEILKLAKSKTAQDFYFKGDYPEFERGVFWKNAKNAGYDAVDLSKIEDIAYKNPPESITILGEKAGFEKEVRLLNLDAFDVKTKSQLTDIYNQATKKATQEVSPTSLDNINTPQVAKTSEVFQSPIGQADQALSKIPDTVRQRVSSLPKIIAQDLSGVKQKVNVIDYLRTPDRVLKKIGLGKEAELLQESYNSYVKELPKNIEKITDWSKQVPKISSERIFKYLDGQEMRLTPTELKVAGEIKEWLKEWAKRLKLPEDKTITNYITHIFDKELIAKEFDEDLAKIITDKIPGSVYDPFLLKRLGAKGYKQNVWDALDAYVKRGTRKANMDEALEAIQKKVGSSLETSNVETSAFKYIQRYISGVNMRPTELDNLLDNSIKSIVGYKYGQRPVTYLTKALRQMTYRGMLGLSLSSAMRNISQGVNTYAVLGEKYTTLGYLKLFSKGARDELASEGVLANHFIQDRNLSSTKKALEKIDKSLFIFFETAEKINRGAAYFGAKAKALKQGKTPEEAVKFAKETVRKTQFLFGAVDTPVALQSDIAKTVAQFQNFTVKQTEFLTEMLKDKNFMGLIRYAVGGMAFVYTIGKAFGMDTKDLLPNFRFDIPPSLKLPVEAGKAILNVPDKYGNERDIEQKASDVGKAAVGLIPAGSQIKKTIEGLQSIERGGSYTKNNKLQFKQDMSLLGRLQSILFGKYAGQNAEDYFNKKKPKKTNVNRFNK